MTRKEFEEFVFDTYNVRADYPFEDDLVTGGPSREWQVVCTCNEYWGKKNRSLLHFPSATTTRSPGFLVSAMT